VKLRSLKSRLIWTSLVWVALSFTISAVVLIAIFYSHIERRFDNFLVSNLEELVAASEFAPDGSLYLSWRPSDPQFIRPLSGWYWEILLDGKIKHASLSLLDSTLAPPVSVVGSGPREFLDLAGPENAPLRAVVQNIHFPNTDRPFTLVVAGPLSDIEKDVWRFGGMVAITLSVLGVTLLGIIFVQVGFGLRPLRLIKQRLAEVRAGKLSQLSEDAPSEVQPVIRELNEVLEYNTRLLERARSQVGNLAHALKIPLTILRSEVRDVEGERGGLMRTQIDAIDRNVDHYLKRARISGRATLGLRTDLRATAGELLDSMKLLHRGRNLTLSFSRAPAVHVPIDPQDLEEMIGNLLDNACKWAATQVVVGWRVMDGMAVVEIGDDGPGIAEDQRAVVLERGHRLDETAPGSGLGLDITREIAETYRGSLELDRAPQGGLLARLRLPAVAG